MVTGTKKVTAAELARQRSAAIPPKRIVSITAEKSVAEAARKMIDNGVGVLPVIDKQDHLIGVITRKDVLKVIVDCGELPEYRTVAELAVSRNYPRIDGHRPVEDAIKEMGARGVRQLPVVEDEQLIGMVTEADVAPFVGTETLREFLKRLRRRRTESSGPQAVSVSDPGARQ
jgi:CBS domain-containing protein